jgi:hypothetical protein
MMNHILPQLDDRGKSIMRKRVHSQLIAFQIIVILDKDEQQTMEPDIRQSAWKREESG